MKKELPTVALIFGGRGHEHEVSIAGAKFLYPKINPREYNKIPIYVTRSGEWRVPTDKPLGITPLVCGRCKSEAVAPTYLDGIPGILSRTVFTPIYAAIPLMHGDYGEDGTVQGALESARIPYVGCDVSTGAITSDKAYTKLVAEHLGIKTAAWILAVNEPTEKARIRAEESLGYPLFIKPARLGSSIGAGAVYTHSEFDDVYESAASLGSGRVLIERKISIKKELECAYFAAKGKETFTNPGEILSGGDCYDYRSKYSPSSTVRTSDSSNLDQGILSQLLEASRSLVNYLGIRDLSRIDFFLSEDGELYFNEINTFPGFTKSSLFPRLLAKSKIPAKSLVKMMITAAGERGG